MMRVFSVALGLVIFGLAACRSAPQEGQGVATPEANAVVAGAEVTAKPKPCASSGECASGERCTTEDGACDRPPGCGPSDVCAEVCYGVCTTKPPAKKPDASSQTVAHPVDGTSGGGACKQDADCRAFSDYCTGCDCRGLGKDAADPKCAGPGVRCLIDPCMRKHAACVAGKCAIAIGAPAM